MKVRLDLELTGVALNEIVQGRLREGIHTYAFFLDVHKAYDTVLRDGLWVKCIGWA